ncbi:MAG: DUF4907 domain-containing protein [Chitinophagales bacterium]
MRMITKHNVLVIGTAVIISALIFILGQPEKKHLESPHKLSDKIFFNQSGWGYDILADDKIIIHQEFVPALPVQKGFNKKEYAEKAAQMVMQKIQENKMPALSKNDLARICSIDTLVYDQSAGR